MKKNRTLSITVDNVSNHIFNTGTIPTLVLGHNNIVELENNASIECFGRSVKGKNITHIITIDKKPPEHYLFDTAFTNKTVTINSPSGIRICNMLLTVERDKYNDALCKVILLSDITELESALVQAKAVSRAKTEFLSGMSHEIRTPMNSIVGFSELALDEDISPKAKMYLMNILENSEGLLQIINDILDISKIESGKMELEKVPFTPHILFEACRTIIMPKALEKGIKVNFYAEQNIGRVPQGDPTRLRQVFINLLSNAVKFTDSGVVRIEASVVDATESSVTIYFEVRDTGIGMTSEQVQMVFDPFMQAELGTTRKYGGTGLGLAITKNIIEMMGGEIFVESAPGNGSKFSFQLTFDTIDITDEELQKKQFVQSELRKPRFEGEVLLFEDNVMNQQVACEHLTRVGLRTIIAENGLIGVDMVQRRLDEGEKLFDLIFMDMHMPVMDGLEAAALIHGMNTGIPIVAMTANIMTSDTTLYEENGINDFVGKPFTSQELWRCLMRYFKPVDWQTDDEAKYKKTYNELRQKLINKFVESNQNKVLEIKSALDARNIVLAHRLVHNLKSNAGQLRKTSLQQVAQNVEDTLKSGESYVTAMQLEALEFEVETVLTELAPLVKKLRVSETPIKTHDIAEAQRILNELEPLLIDSNTDCISYIDDLRSIPGSEELIAQLEDFDFKLALESLAALMESIEMLYDKQA